MDEKESEKRVYDNFVRKIYEYCDNSENLGCKVLFLGFRDQCPDSEHEITPQDLSKLTNEIIYDLEKKGIVREIPNPKPEQLVTPYPMYEILPRERLINPPFYTK